MPGPIPRWNHAAVMSDYTLYLTGGKATSAAGSSTIASSISVDLSVDWTLDDPPISPIDPIPYPIDGHTMTLNPDGTTLLLIGGESSVANFTPILRYDTVDDTWSQYKPLAGIHRLFSASLVTNLDGVMVHGGFNSNVTTGANVTTLNTLVTFKNSNGFLPSNQTAVGQAAGAPSRARHTIARTTDGKAVMLGGITNGGLLANLTEAYVMDTQSPSAVWTRQPLSGQAPQPRVGFTTVVVNASTLAVFGGTPDFKTAYSTVYYLDLPSWTWSSPPATGNAPSLWGHTATIVGTTMVVSFGMTSVNEPSSSFALLDVKANNWMTAFKAKGVTSPGVAGGSYNAGSGSQSADSGASGSGGLPMGAILALGFVGTIAVVGGAFFMLVHRRRRRTRNTQAKEDLKDQAARSALRHQQAHGHYNSNNSSLGRGGFSAAAQFVGRKLAGKPVNRYSDMSLQPGPGDTFVSPLAAIGQRMTQRGYSPLSLGYPNDVVQHGTGMVPVADYVYPNQALVESEKDHDGRETSVVFHSLTHTQIVAQRTKTPTGSTTALTTGAI